MRAWNMKIDFQVRIGVIPILDRFSTLMRIAIRAYIGLSPTRRTFSWTIYLRFVGL